MFMGLPYRMGVAPAFRPDAVIVSPPRCPSDNVSGCGDTAATTTECFWDAADNRDTDLDAVEEVALSAECTPDHDEHSNGNLRRLATHTLAAPLTSPQSSPTPTATNGQTSPTLIPSLDGSKTTLVSSTCSHSRSAM